MIFLLFQDNAVFQFEFKVRNEVSINRVFLDKCVNSGFLVRGSSGDKVKHGN